MNGGLRVGDSTNPQSPIPNPRVSQPVVDELARQRLLDVEHDAAGLAERADAFATQFDELPVRDCELDDKPLFKSPIEGPNAGP